MARSESASAQLLARETLKGLLIGAVPSLFIAYLVFAGRASIPLAGMGGVIFDAVPQSIGIFLLGSAVPALLTKKQAASGQLGDVRPSGRGVLSAVVPIALLMAGLSIAAQVLLLPQLTPATWDLGAVLAYKTLYGALLSALAARLGVRAMIEH